MNENYSIPSQIRIVSNKNLKNIFITFSILSFILLLILFIIPDGKTKVILAVISPLCLMIAYGYIVWIKGRNIVPLDVIGDSIYYLGFLITLASLVFALVAAGTTDQAFNRVLPQFAIALISTVVGLFARVVIAQFSNSEEDMLEVSEKNLVDSATAFRAELDISLATYKNFTFQVEKEVQEIIENNSIQLTTFFEKNSEEFSDFTTKIESKVQSIIENNAIQLNLFFKKNSDSFAERSTHVLDALTESTDSFKRKTQQIETTFDLLNKNIINVNEKFEGADKEILSLRSAFSELSNSFTDNNMLEDLKNLPQLINEYNVNIEQVKISLLKDRDIISNVKNNIQDNLTKSNEAMKSVHDNMTDAVKIVVEKLKK